MAPTTHLLTSTTIYHLHSIIAVLSPVITYSSCTYNAGRSGLRNYVPLKLNELQSALKLRTFILLGYLKTLFLNFTIKMFKFFISIRILLCCFLSVCCVLVIVSCSQVSCVKEIPISMRLPD